MTAPDVELQGDDEAELQGDDDRDDGRTSTDPGTAVADGAPDPSEPADSEVFPRDYVDKLRRQNADYRTKAAKTAEYAEQLSQQLWVERVAALNLLADPTDLPYDAEKLTDTAAIQAAAEELLTRKPHLRTRRITSRVGQGETSTGERVSLAGMLRQHA